MYRYLYLGTLELSTYSLFNTLAIFAALIYNLFTYKKKETLLSQLSLTRIQQKKASLKSCVIAEIILLTGIQTGLGGFTNSLLAKITPGVVVNYFGNILLAPFLFTLVLILVQINPLRQLDLIAPSYALTLIFFKIACFMHGCCEGMPTEFGLYYPYNGQYEFPSQLLEALVALIIFFILLYAARRPRRVPGLMFPLYSILYSTTRFFTEFTRANAPIIWKLQPYHLFCLAGILFGVLEWIFLVKHGAKLDRYFEQRFAKHKK